MTPIVAFTADERKHMAPQCDDTFRRLSEHDLAKALANYHAVVIKGGKGFRAWNELSDPEQRYYLWAASLAIRVIWEG